jgi:hypothetical protein
MTDQPAGVVLPELPEPDGSAEIDMGPYKGPGSERPNMAGARVISTGPAWSEALVRAYATAAVLEERERCAKLCEASIDGYTPLDSLSSEVPWEAESIGEIRMAVELAAAIRQQGEE